MEYIVPTNKKPSYWNQDTAVGTVIGSILGSFIPVPFLGTAIGAAIGAYIGKERMEHELRNGKVVKPPTLFNKKIAVGALKGMVAGSVIGWAAVFGLVFLGAATLVGGAALFTLGAGGIGGLITGTAGIAAAVLAATTLIACALPIVGAIKGAFSGKAQMAKEYRAAEQSQGVTPVRQASEAEDMEFNNPTLPGKSFAADVAASKQAPAPGITGR